MKRRLLFDAPSRVILSMVIITVCVSSGWVVAFRIYTGTVVSPDIWTNIIWGAANTIAVLVAYGAGYFLLLSPAGGAGESIVDEDSRMDDRRR